MVATKNDMKISNSTTDVFTTNNSINWDDKINFNFDYNWCQHLLPCGLCARTDRPCPKYKGNMWEPVVTWKNCSESISSSPLKNTINMNYTTGDKQNG